MKKFKHILASTDLSPESFPAVRNAVELARAQGARLTILHVIDTTTMAYIHIDPPIDLDDLTRQIEIGARAKLDGWAKRACKGYKKCDVLVRHGAAYQMICDTASAIGADLIVMSTHGRQGFGRVLLGSVTDRVLRLAPCSVLVVRPPKPTAGRKKTA